MCYDPESLKSEGMLVVEITDNDRQQGHIHIVRLERIKWGAKQGLFWKLIEKPEANWHEEPYQQIQQSTEARVREVLSSRQQHPHT